MAFLRNCSDELRKDYLICIYETLEYKMSEALSSIMLTWEQIKEMNNHGVSFGAHTHTHPILSRLSIKEAESEIQISKEIIQSRLKSKVTGFAYPVGARDHIRSELIPILKKNDFSHAVTTSTDQISHESEPLQLSRPFPWELCMV